MASLNDSQEYPNPTWTSYKIFRILFCVESMFATAPLPYNMYTQKQKYFPINFPLSAMSLIIIKATTSLSPLITSTTTTIIIIVIII